MNLTKIMKELYLPDLSLIKIGSTTISDSFRVISI